MGVGVFGFCESHDNRRFLDLYEVEKIGVHLLQAVQFKNERFCVFRFAFFPGGSNTVEFSFFIITLSMKFVYSFFVYSEKNN